MPNVKKKKKNRINVCTRNIHWTLAVNSRVKMLPKVHEAKSVVFLYEMFYTLHGVNLLYMGCTDNTYNAYQQ